MAAGGDKKTKRTRSGSGSPKKKPKTAEKKKSIEEDNKSAAASKEPPKELKNKYAMAVLCSSNQNRSMEAHCVLKRKGYAIESYGTGNNVKLPGPAPDKPNIYAFGTPYQDMYVELESRDKDLYTRNGILTLLDRNRNCKLCPQKFQEENEKEFDLIITCEDRVFEQCLEYFEGRESESMHPVHIVNFDIKDNAECAAVGGVQINKFVDYVFESDDLENDIEDIIERVQEETNQTLLHSTHYY
eukprot:Nk52_evm7s284 gene=Nk52_evmTU7s284